MSNKIYRLLHSLGIHHAFRYYKHKKGLATVLCLHRISNEDSVTFPPLKPENFEKLLRYISRHYFVTTIGELPYINSSKPAIVLSFDDGFKDLYENGLPLLKVYNMPCNVNVVTKCLDGGFEIWTQKLNNIFDTAWQKKYPLLFYYEDIKFDARYFTKEEIFSQSLHTFLLLFKRDEKFITAFLDELERQFPFEFAPTPMMNWAELNQALIEFDIELGSHSSSHFNLSNFANRQDIKDEIFLSKKQIEEKTKRPIHIFAPPNGSYNKEVVEFCLEAGYKHILSVDEKLIPKQEIQSGIIPRILIPYESFSANLMKVENFQNEVKRFLKKRV
jgi:peptidoglycan/xylan/chitin deacetylase (PgdA/CDA1 family)